MVLLGLIGGSEFARANALQRVSVVPDGIEANDQSIAPTLSADGRFIAYMSYATNLVARDTNRRVDIFLYDRINKTTRRMNVTKNGSQANDASFLPKISGSGKFVAFEFDCHQPRVR